MPRTALPLLAAAAAPAAVAASGARRNATAGGGYDDGAARALADFAKITYCLPYTGAFSWGCADCLRWPGVTAIRFGDGFGGVTGAACNGFVYYDPQFNNLGVAFAGLSNFQGMFAGIDLSLQSSPYGAGKVYGGNYASFLKQKDTILAAFNKLYAEHQDAQIWVTGHSFGGGHALFGALELLLHSDAKRVDGVYTFGGVRAGDAAFSSFYDSKVGADRTFRLTHYMDPVPHGPAAGYLHAGTEVHYGLGVEQGGNYKVCAAPGEDKSCAAKYPINPMNPLDGALWSYHTCYPGQCGYPAALGLPCEGICVYPATSMFTTGCV